MTYKISNHVHLSTVLSGMVQDAATRVSRKGVCRDMVAIERCQALAGDSNIRYFGLQYGRECYATRNATSTFNDGQNPQISTMACAGNSTQLRYVVATVPTQCTTVQEHRQRRMLALWLSCGTWIESGGCSACMIGCQGPCSRLSNSTTGPHPH
jgi:hypothetical protein